MPDETTQPEEAPRKEVGITTDPVAEATCLECNATIDVSDFPAFADISCPECGKAQTVPARLGPFLLLRLLGTGGMGGVYYAKDATLGRFVAIKVMLKSLGDNRDFVETFKREAQAVARLNHPNIAQIYSFGEEKGQPYIVMELVAGERLDKMIQERRHLSEGMVMRIGLEVAEGLAAADEAGLVHGDIKPENILLDEKGVAKLVDFGLATFVHQQVQDGIWGTPYYIAPEKLRRQPLDARSDIYSLGATLFHALALHPPFEGETAVEVAKARLERPAPPLSEAREGVNADVERIIARMLSAEPSRRHPTYASLIGDLRKNVDELNPRGVALAGKKIVLRKKGAPTMSAPKPSPSRIVVPQREAPSVVTASVRDPSTTGSAPTPTKKKSSGSSKATLWILLVLLLMGGGVAGGMYFMDRQKKARAASLELLARDDALASVDKAMESAEEAWESIATLRKRTDAAFLLASNNVQLVESYALPPLTRPLVIDPAKPDGDTPAPADDPVTNTVDAGEAVAADEADAKEPADAGADEADTEATDGTEGDEAAPEGTNAVVGVEQPITNMPVVVEVPTSAIMGPVSSVVANCEQALADIGKGETLLLEARHSHSQAHAAQWSRQVKSFAETIKANTLAIEELESPLRELVEKAEAAAKETTAIQEDVLDKRRREAEAAAQAERERLAAEQAAREAEEHAARVAAELAIVAQVNEEQARWLAVHDYAMAARQMKFAAGRVKTKEGRLAMAIAMNRYDRLDQMRQFIVRRINESPFKWGWIQGPFPEDVLEATEVSITIRSGRVAWSEVSMRQMLNFIKHYIASDNAAHHLRLRELADMYINAAIFCRINGGEQVAQHYKQRAIDLLPQAKKRADRLLPDLEP